MKKSAVLLLSAISLTPLLHAQTIESDSAATVLVDTTAIYEEPHYMLGAAELANAKTYRSIAEAMKSPKEVYKLSLKGQNLKTLPEEIALFSNLQVLDLSENKLSALPDEIGSLSFLQVLNLYNNRLVRLPESIANLSELTTLYVGSNRLPEMPLWVGGLGKLRTLDVSYNGLTTYEIEMLMRILPKCNISH